MIMLSDLWRTEEDRITKNTKNKNATTSMSNSGTTAGLLDVPSRNGHGADRKCTLPAKDSSPSAESFFPGENKRQHQQTTAEPPRRIRCKARLLSMVDDHNADTAYFEIHLDTPHGMVLSCSHPVCAASGRRFRYCRGKEMVLCVCVCGVFASVLRLCCVGQCGRHPSL